MSADESCASSSARDQKRAAEQGHRPWRALAAVLGASLLLVGGCAPEPTRLETFERLRDSAAGPLPATGAPTAEVGSQTREVLAAPAAEVVLFRRRLVVPEDRRAEVDVQLGVAFAGAKRVAFSSRAQGPAGSFILEPSSALVEEAAGRPRATIRVSLAPFAPGDTIHLTAEALRAPDRIARHRTNGIEIPEAAVLEFATGVLGLAAAQGPVRFSVSACRDEECTRVFSEEREPSEDWDEWLIDVGALAGQTRELVFETEPLHGGPDAWSLPVWGHPTLRAPSRGEVGPSLLLVSIDTLRADHVTSYGYHRDTAPFVDRELGARGAVFERFIAAATTTDPSHMTLFTSLPPSVHGVHGIRRTATPVVTLAEALRDAGFETAAFTENGPLAAGRGFARGFLQYTENKSPHLLMPKGHVELTFEQGRRWLEAQQGRRSFLFLHTFQVHAPYAPPPGYAAEFTGSERKFERADGADVQGMVDAYDREIRYVDDQLRALLAWLEHSGLAESTVVVITSDHGEAFMEHGSLGHQAIPHEELLRVPLVIAGPGVRPGLRVGQPLAHIDLMPSLLDLLGVEAPAHMLGRSFRALLAGDGTRAGAAERPLFSESWGLPKHFQPPAIAVRSGTRKLIRYDDGAGERFEYYDLGVDPGEQRDLHATRGAEAADLRALLDDYVLEADRLRAALQASSEPGAPAPGGEVLLDPEREEKLRALGYIE